MTLKSSGCCTLGNTREAEEDNKEDVAHNQPVATTLNAVPRGGTVAVEYNSDQPLTAFVNGIRTSSLHQGGSANLCAARMSDPTPLHHIRLQEEVVPPISEEIHASAPQPTQPSSKSGAGEPSHRICEPSSQGQKRRRLRRAHERVSKNPKRPNRVVQACILGTGHLDNKARDSNKGI